MKMHLMMAVMMGCLVAGNSFADAGENEAFGKAKREEAFAQAKQAACSCDVETFKKCLDALQADAAITKDKDVCNELFDAMFECSEEEKRTEMHAYVLVNKKELNDDARKGLQRMATVLTELDKRVEEDGSVLVLQQGCEPCMLSKKGIRYFLRLNLAMQKIVDEELAQRAATGVGQPVTNPA